MAKKTIKKAIKVEAPIEEPKIKTEFSVFNAQGEFVRTYSVERHGVEADKMAEMYAGKIGGIIK
jgi:hypothetical protein